MGAIKRLFSNPMVESGRKRARKARRSSTPMGTAGAEIPPLSSGLHAIPPPPSKSSAIVAKETVEALRDKITFMLSTASLQEIPPHVCDLQKLIPLEYVFLYQWSSFLEQFKFYCLRLAPLALELDFGTSRLLSSFADIAKDEVDLLLHMSGGSDDCDDTKIAAKLQADPLLKHTSRMRDARLGRLRQVGALDASSTSSSHSHSFPPCVVEHAISSVAAFFVPTKGAGADTCFASLLATPAARALLEEAGFVELHSSAAIREAFDVQFGSAGKIRYAEKMAAFFSACSQHGVWCVDISAGKERASALLHRVRGLTSRRHGQNVHQSDFVWIPAPLAQQKGDDEGRYICNLRDDPFHRRHLSRAEHDALLRRLLAETEGICHAGIDGVARELTDAFFTLFSQAVDWMRIEWAHEMKALNSLRRKGKHKVLALTRAV